MAKERAVVMPETVWFRLCAKQCKIRRKQYGFSKKECNDEGGICSECASDAILLAPKKYRTTPAIAAQYDTLPGL